MMREPRFPSVAPGAGHYESFFVKAHHPTEPRAFWLRHTVHQRPGEPQTASVWLTLFDAAAEEPVRAGKATSGPPGVPAGGAYITIDGCALTPEGGRGTLASPTLTADWDFTVQSGEPEQRHLPADWMYGARLPRTKSGTPQPGATFSGVMAGTAIDGWQGLVSHNWGSEHAERWIWLHATLPDGGWLELVAGRIRVGPWTTPWLANGAVSLDGTRHRIGGPRHARGTLVDERPTGARLVIPGDDVRVELSVAAPAEHFVCWRYADPDGPEHHSAHSSIAAMDLEIRADGAPPRRISGPAAYELGMRETDHGLAVQPYADGSR